MTQNASDYTIANAAGATVRGDINDVFEDAISCYLGLTAPTTTVAGMFWFDSANNVLKIRNEGDSAWITLAGSVTASNETNAGLTVNGQLHVDHADGVKFSDATEQTVAAALITPNQTVKTDTQVLSAPTSWTDVTGLSVAVTPASTSSKVLITVDLKAITETDAGPPDWRAGFWRIVRNGSVLSGYIGDAASPRWQAAGSIPVEHDTTSTGNVFSCCGSFLDSPASTSTQTYKVQVVAQTGDIYINRSQLDAASTNYGRFASTITATEYAPTDP